LRYFYETMVIYHALFVNRFRLIRRKISPYKKLTLIKEEAVL
jgi:hypothetical protein